MAKHVNVRLLSSMNDVCEVWKISKPQLKSNLSNEDALLRMQLPIGGFKVYTLEFTASILFRDLMFTLRPLTPWAISLRSFSYTSESIQLSLEEASCLEGNEILELLNKIDDVIERVNNGESTDSAKQDLPMLTSTTFCVNINHRTLMNYLYTLELHIPRYFKIFSNLIFEAINFSKENYEKSSKIDLINYLKLKDNELTLSGHNSIGDIHYLFSEIQSNLMAQFIRQHTAIVKNGLYNRCIDNLSDALKLTCKDLIKVGAYLTSDSLNHLVRTRICWFAQFDKSDKSSWNFILKDYIKGMSKYEFRSYLPCGGDSSKCNIKEDMINRIHHEDMAPPCPLILEDPNIINIREDYYKSESIIFDKWKEICDDIYLNIDNEYFKVYSKES